MPAPIVVPATRAVAPSTVPVPSGEPGGGEKSAWTAMGDFGSRGCALTLGAGKIIAPLLATNTKSAGDSMRRKHKTHSHNNRDQERSWQLLSAKMPFLVTFLRNPPSFPHLRYSKPLCSDKFRGASTKRACAEIVTSAAARNHTVLNKSDTRRRGAAGAGLSVSVCAPRACGLLLASNGCPHAHAAVANRRGWWLVWS